MVKYVDICFGGGYIRELYFFFAARLRVSIFEFFKEVEQRIVRVLQESVEIELSVAKQKI